MINFDVENARTKDELNSFKDFTILFSYLYSDKDNYIEYQGHHIIMDTNHNLLYRPVDATGNAFKSTDDLLYVCANDISYKDLCDMIEHLKSTGEWNKIKNFYAILQTLNF